MAVGKEIRNQINSIKSTQKITSAMEMVAASKMRKAQDQMELTRPYADKIRQVVQHVAAADPEYRHPFMEEREVQRVGYVVVTTDRGLCGGLNANLLKTLVTDMREWHGEDIEIDLCVIGQKGVGFFKSFGGKVVSTATHLGDAPTVKQLIGTIKVMLDAYHEGRIDRLYMVNNRFVNTMTQKPEISQLLPLPKAKKGDEQDVGTKYNWDYIYEPNAKSLLDGLLTRFLETQVYQGVVENLACEQAARMIAMKSATDNAGEIMNDLQLAYNKARQAAITQEISEIVGGAAAV